MTTLTVEDLSRTALAELDRQTRLQAQPDKSQQQRQFTPCPSQCRAFCPGRRNRVRTTLVPFRRLTHLQAY
ncbi:MAG: hypothetical protein AAF446_00660 [Pseudomonadota bacterium]